MSEQTEVKKPKPIEPGTPEMEAMLQAGYPGMTVDRAKQIITERAKNPQAWPLERAEQAQAYLDAYGSKARPVSTDPGWHRQRA